MLARLILTAIVSALTGAGIAASIQSGTVLCIDLAKFF